MRRRGATVGLAVGTFPRPGRGRCPVLIPPTCESCAWGRGWDPPMGVCARCRGYRPPLGAGTKRPVASPPPRHTQPARPLALVGVGEGARGSAVPIRTLGGPNCLYIASEGGAGSNRTRRPCRRCWGASGGGGGGGVRGSMQSAGGRRGLEPQTCGPHRPPCPRLRAKGSLVPTRGSRVPTPFDTCARVSGGKVRAQGLAKATRGHDAWCMHREGGMTHATP